MTTVVFCLEELSARVFLEGLLPRLLSEDITVKFIVFNGKQDMHRRLGGKLRGWLGQDTLFVVLRDKDASDCKRIKDELVEICTNAGRPDSLVRIAVHCLESWYLGDLETVERVLDAQGVGRKQASRKFRDPDRLSNSDTELKALAPSYQKVDGSRKMGPEIRLDENCSKSFQVFLTGLKRFLPA